ncbi:hypothetical protein BABINDRAFT_162126 [Babjeviella inositovora NRRL Y-12698]|uniref:Major facilitator superfamily (MFS) profile domain-containing protein n=1 Tax=Babjeviella inositovora NRRL Y-12698 TaxID=984486 RepID=A0A1E3QMW6_9ASCO|nr:uncharacterized protein BABINDRAFT_162126 [Babjeviella inositovora NRRL Y-12698]ODQ79056.1 hypothetical protein BABINDRAFT_162126 [Babjeviella inositovora NRRL Y-12698]
MSDPVNLNGPIDAALASENAVLQVASNGMKIEGPNATPGLLEKPDGMLLSDAPKNLYRVIMLCYWSFCGGLSDGAPGALLPTIEAHYNISYSIVSLIWMFNAIGYLTIAFFAGKLDRFASKHIQLTCAVFCMTICYALVASGGPFEVIVLGFFFGGLGLAIGLSLTNVFLGRMHNSSKYLGYSSGSYGVGATVAPLIATAMIDRGIKWNYFYLIVVGLSCCNVVAIWFIFSDIDADLSAYNEKLADYDRQQEAIVCSLSFITDGSGQTKEELETKAVENMGEQDLIETVSPKIGTMSEAIRTKIVWLFSFFVLCYQGGEVSIGGWIVTFLLEYRHSNSTSTGYVASGFWGGLTLGRLFLTHPLALFFGARRGVLYTSILGVVLVVLTWVVNHVIVEAVFISLAGLVTGPIYPLMISRAADLIDPHLFSLSMVIMTAFGSSGGALFPFFTGLIGEYRGSYVVMPMVISLFGSMIIIWLVMPLARGVKLVKWWQKFV